jgi:hypothetical protein
MNIRAAAHYLKIGYRVRRSIWDQEQYLYEIAGMLEMVEVSYCSSWDHKTKTIVENRSVSSGNIANLQLEDIMADDWELITDGIRKHFNKYDDEPDWNNYKSDSSWDNQEEDEE